MAWGDRAAEQFEKDQPRVISAYLSPKEPDPDAVTWAMDICSDTNHPYYGNPIAAHQIVSEEDGGKTRITACGKRLTASNHPRGWWTTRPGELPLGGELVHCIADPLETLAAHVLDADERRGD